MLWTLCLSTQLTSSSVLKPSGEFEPTTLGEAGGFVRLLDDDTFSLFLKIFNCILSHFAFQPAPEADHRLSLCPGNHAAVHTVFFFFFFLLQRTLFNTSGSRPPNYGLKKQLPHRKVLRVEAPTCVDCEGPFIAACSFNWNWYYMIRKNKNVSDWSLYWKWKQ